MSLPPITVCKFLFTDISDGHPAAFNLSVFSSSLATDVPASETTDQTGTKIGQPTQKKPDAISWGFSYWTKKWMRLREWGRRTGQTSSW